MRRLTALALFVVALTRPVRSFETAFVEYDIDGTAKYADVTCTNGSNGTEQKQIKFPFHESFRAPVGMGAYISAQKVKVTRPDPTSIYGNIEVLADGVHGTVHVTVHINWKLAGEATADAPFGIAKVSAEVK